MNLTEARTQLAPYGYDVAETGHLILRDKTLSVFIAKRGPRWQARRPDGSLIWSGGDLGNFVASYYYATPRRP